MQRVESYACFFNYVKKTWRFEFDSISQFQATIDLILDCTNFARSRVIWKSIFLVFLHFSVSEISFSKKRFQEKLTNFDFDRSMNTTRTFPKWWVTKMCGTFLDVVIENLQILVSIRSCVFVPESNHMANLVNDYSKLNTIVRQIYSLWSSVPHFPNKGATSKFRRTIFFWQVKISSQSVTKLLVKVLKGYHC